MRGFAPFASTCTGFQCLRQFFGTAGDRARCAWSPSRAQHNTEYTNCSVQHEKPCNCAAFRYRVPQTEAFSCAIATENQEAASCRQNNRLGNARGTFVLVFPPCNVPITQHLYRKRCVTCQFSTFPKGDIVPKSIILPRRPHFLVLRQETRRGTTAKCASEQLAEVLIQLFGLFRTLRFSSH